MDEGVEDEQYENDPWSRFLDTLEGYCDSCEVAGHTFRTCPRRDDNELWDE